MGRGRRKEQPLIAGEKPATRCFSTAIGNPVSVASIHSHDVLLIARVPVASALKRQPLSVMTEVRLRVLAAEGELADCAEVGLSGRWRQGFRGSGNNARASRRARCSGD